MIKKMLLLKGDTKDQIIPFLGWCGFFLMGYYTVFNYVDHGSDHLPFLLTLVFIFSLGVICHQTRYKKYSKVLLLLPSQVFMTDLIYKAGGIQAPGVFWLSAMPILWALMFQIKGLVIGLLLTFLTYFALYVANPELPLAEYFPTSDAIGRARIENLILFTLFMAAFVLAYTIVIVRSQKAVSEKQKEVESLLKILVHDISNPLMVIRGRIQVRPKMDGDELIVKSADRIQEIIHDVRRLFALRDGKADFNLSPVQLHHCLTDSIQGLEDQIRRKDVKVIVVPFRQEYDLLLDRTLVTNQVMTNILSNAIKFSPIGGQVTIRVSRSGGYACVDIEDEGIGIPEDKLGQIFSMTGATSRNGTAGEKGTGYGLPIVYQIMSKLEGKVEVYSPSAKGQKAGTRVRLLFKI